MHNTTTRNILETSHAYTYIKPKIKKNYVQIDIEALLARYHKPSTQDMLYQRGQEYIVDSFLKEWKGHEIQGL